MRFPLLPFAPLLAPDDLPPPSDGAVPPRRARLVCEFCESQLSGSGDVLEMSDKAKSLRRLSEDLDRVKGQLADATAALESANARVREVEAQLATLPAPAPARGGGFNPFRAG